ncbi:MAG: response regulator [Rhodocyclaceae bacterium]|nr:response regulator [Rhodocyclaceae bacterium]
MSKTILTVDDSVSIRQMVSFTLKSAGYSVVQAADGEEGLAMAKANPVQLIITDQNMPKMDGLSMVKALRATSAHARTPILLLTTESSDAMKAQGKAAGATGWLVKPFDPNKLLDVVRRCIG